jgi:hypothetical protein
MKCAIGSPAACAQLGINPIPILNDHWFCAPPPGGAASGAFCHFLIPVKRLNPMPDKMGLVFFDGDEVDNAAYAVASMIQSVQPGALCDSAASQSGNMPFTRSFQSSYIADHITR